MKIIKIMGLVAVAAAIVGAFVTIPNLATFLVILGLIGGFVIDGSRPCSRHRLGTRADGARRHLEQHPVSGQLSDRHRWQSGCAGSGAAIMIILRNVYNRFKP